MSNAVLLIYFFLIIMFQEINKAQSSSRENNFIKFNQSIMEDGSDDNDRGRNMEDYGIQFSIYFINDFLQNLSGGIKTGSSYIGLLNPNLNIDLDKMFNWKETDLWISAIGNIGNNFNNKVGAEQGIDNIAAFNTWKIYELWIEHKILDNLLSFKFGLYDLNSEFDFRLTSLIFLNPAHAIGSEFALTGKNGPSIFPTTSLAFRIKYLDQTGFYFQTAIFDGIPGDPNNHRGNHIIIKKNDGLLLTAETGFISNVENFGEDYEKYFIGGWFYTSKFERLLPSFVSGNPVYKIGNYGLYFSAEKFIWSEPLNSNNGLAAYLRVGISDESVNKVDGYLGAGMSYTGLIPSRDMDQFGIGISMAQNSGNYISLMHLENINLYKFETIIEMTYLLYLTDRLQIQPDFQYVIHPADCYSNKYAFISALRLELSL